MAPKDPPPCRGTLRGVKHLCALALLALLPTAASAQPDVFFGPTDHPVVFVEEDLDKRFARTQLGRALSEGTDDPSCMHVLGGLFTLLAEAAPTLHKRDQNFYLDPTLVHAMNVQLTSPRFPGNAALVAMVRRVMIERRLPEAWLSVAAHVNQRVMIIDMGKLQFLAHGTRPVESYFFTIPALRQRYELEVLRATTASQGDAVAAFRDAYLDREVAWGALRLIDVGPPAPVKPVKGKKGKQPRAPPPADYLVARLEVLEPAPDAQQLQLFGNTRKDKPTIIEARLADTQYVNVARIPRGKRLMVRGRFWEMSDDLKRLELRDALLFEDRDWSAGALLADPGAVAACPLAINELAGTAPVQPGGFGQRPGQAAPPRR
jgi:hypothetical protein